MNEVTQLRHVRSASEDAIRVAVEAGVRAAIAEMTDAQLQDVVMAPFRELRLDSALRQAA